MRTEKQTYNSEHPYQSGLTRRETLKWLGALSVSAAFPLLTACDTSSSVSQVAEKAMTKGHWPQLKLPAITAAGYGKDPKLIMPPSSPWPLTLSEAQLTLVAVLSDILVPKEADVPSASEVLVPDVVNEWLSSPYEGQQQDRVEILTLLLWLDAESQQRFSGKFVDLQVTQQLTIIDDIAYKTALQTEEFAKPCAAFSRLRRLVLAAFFCSPQGTKDLGYQGNVPIAGDYPGPTEEAMDHLNGLLTKLGLSL